MTVEDSDLALPQTLPEIFEAAATSKVSLGFPRLHHDGNVCGCLVIYLVTQPRELGGILQVQVWLDALGLFCPAGDATGPKGL